MLHYTIKNTNNKQISLLGHRLFVTFVASLAVAASNAASPSTPLQPKIVVGIVVEDLQNEYINLLKEHFSAGGFNRLLRDGVVIANVDFGTPVDAAAATATIYTGASPSVNGIPAAEIFDRSTLHGIPVFNDPSTIGNYTSQTFSPRALNVSTIADEAIISGGGVTYAYAIAPDPERAIIMAGHAGNCGLWLNDVNECWATSTYYKDVPSSLNMRNRLEPLKNRIDTISWTPLRSTSEYILLPDHLKMYPFKYNFRKKDHLKMKQFLNSPKANEEITQFAIESIRQLGLGEHNGPDVISLGYSLVPYEYSINTDNRYELLDAYFRLDKDLETLFSYIDHAVGPGNALIFLAGTPQHTEAVRDNERWRIPYGEFSTRKAISLLNLNLIASYGNGDWVQGYHNGHFFLNHQLIEQNKLNLEEIRLSSARFLERMAGINKAYAIDEILDGRTEANANIRKNTNAALAGDIYVNVMPGWQIIDDYNNANRRTDKVVRSVAATAPAFILAPTVEPKVISHAVDARAIAPTVTSLLRIRSPNGAEVAPLSLEYK